MTRSRSEPRKGFGKTDPMGRVGAHRGCRPTAHYDDANVRPPLAGRRGQGETVHRDAKVHVGDEHSGRLAGIRQIESRAWPGDIGDAHSRVGQSLSENRPCDFIILDQQHVHVVRLPPVSGGANGCPIKSPNRCCSLNIGTDVRTGNAQKSGGHEVAIRWPSSRGDDRIGLPSHGFLVHIWSIACRDTLGASD